jgi:hypothetical protein
LCVLLSQPELPPLTPLQQEQLRQGTLDAAEAHRLAFELNSDEAMGVAERVVTYQREVSGAAHEDVAEALEWSAVIAKRLARFEEANAALREALGIRTQAQGPGHWQTIDARYALERGERLVGLDRPRRETYRAAQRVLGRAEKLDKPYEFQRRVELESEALGLLKEALSEAHPEYAFCLERFAKNTF